MMSRLKISAIIVGSALGLNVFTESSIAAGLDDIFKKVQNDFSSINEQGAQERARIRSGAQTNGDAMATQPETPEQHIQMTVPRDPKVKAAIDAALPNIKKVLAIHQCIRAPQQLLQLNALAIPGVNMMSGGDSGSPMYSYPNNQGSMFQYMKYHDPSKCVDIRSIDRFSLLALNALSFRVVYLAKDSGETVNFGFLFKKDDDGSWLLGQPPEKVQ